MHGVTASSPPFALPDYEVDRLLGEGGQAQVFLAHHRTLGRKVAIKVLRHNQDESMARRMLQEGRIIASLRHPNLVQVFDAGQTPEGQPYIVMEYVDGAQLNHWRENHPLTIGDALALTGQVAAGLAVAHEAGIIHRDVKPLNIMVETRTGVAGPRFCAKLLDFGVARPSGSDETAVGMIIGTVGFMAPEVYDGEPTSASDIFSLGVVLYWLLTGQNGVRATKIRSRLREGRTNEPWRQHPKLVDLVLGMVASSASDRPQSGAELMRQLEELRPWTQFDQPDSSSTETAVVPSRHRGSPALMAALVGGCISVFLGTALFLVGSQYMSHTKPPNTPTPIPPIAPTAERPTAGGPVAAPPTPAPPPTPPPSPDEVAAAVPQTAPKPAPSPAPATGSAAPPEETLPSPPPPTTPPLPPQDASATESVPAPPAPTAPESTPPPPTFAVGRYPGTIQGRAFSLELSGSASALRAVLDLHIGSRTETHTMTGAATLKGDVWHIAAAESGGKWTLQGTLSGERLQASVAIKGKNRGSIDTRRTQ